MPHAQSNLETGIAYTSALHVGRGVVWLGVREELAAVSAQRPVPETPAIWPRPSHC